jgi:hypothetical protein
MHSFIPTGTAVKPRCPRCAGPLERFDGDGDHEAYCQDCLSWCPAAEPPPAPPAPAAPATTWYVASTSGGAFVESGTDLDKLIRIVRDEVMGPACSEDCLISLGPRVVAVIQGDTGAVVHVR